MPTTLERIQVTVTPELDKALNTARALWPDLPASQQVTVLATAGARTLSRGWSSRHQAVMETQGSLKGAYPPGYLEELRKDWDGRP